MSAPQQSDGWSFKGPPSRTRSSGAKSTSASTSSPPPSPPPAPRIAPLSHSPRIAPVCPSTPTNAAPRRPRPSTESLSQQNPLPHTHPGKAHSFTMGKATKPSPSVIGKDMNGSLKLGHSRASLDSATVQQQQPHLPVKMSASSDHTPKIRPSSPSIGSSTSSASNSGGEEELLDSPQREEHNVVAPPGVGAPRVDVFWSQTHIMTVVDRYHKMVQILSDNLNLVRILANCMPAAGVDAFSMVLVRIFSRMNKILPLIRLLLRDEFKLVSADSGSVLRGNSVVSKMNSYYTHMIGTAFLQKMLSDLLVEVVNNTELRLEIDPSKLNQEERIDEDSALENNRKMLREIAQIFVDRITDKEMLRIIPRELRCIAYYIAELANKHIPEQTIPLVGSFIILRVISPALVAPEKYDLLPNDVVPSRVSRRNLILLAKLLQNCSNCVLFGSKEPYMVCMNNFVMENGPKLATYFERVVDDDRVSPAAVESKQNIGFGSRSRSKTGKSALLEANVPWAEFESPDDISFNIQDFDLSDLFECHISLYAVGDQLTRKIQSGPEKHTVPDEDRSIFLSLLQSLGPPPVIASAAAAECDALYAMRRRRDGSNSLSDSGNLGDLRNRLRSESESDPSVSVDVSALEKAGFMYLGAKSKKGYPVLYIVINRFKKECLDNLDSLISFVYKMFAQIGESRYILVIDMSWARVSNDTKQRVYQEISKMSSVFEYRIRKNLHKAYIVHPSPYTRAVVMFMRQFTSRKLKKKIVEIYDWKELAEDISMENISLPDSSKDYITKAYSVTKVNAKGKKQTRLIKFTHNSFLNVDPKTKRVQNEKLLSEIQSVGVNVKENEIQIRFTPPDSIQNKRMSFITIQKDVNDLIFRRYITSAASDQQDIIDDLFRTAFHMHINTSPQLFNVVKVNNRGRHQDRIFRLTQDSVLNLDTAHYIKSEISFAGIESVNPDASDANVLYLKLKMETKERKIICTTASDLITSLRDGMERYRMADELQQEREFAVTSVE